MISGCSYSGYYSTLDDAIKTFEEYQNYLFDDCAFMFNEVNSEALVQSLINSMQKSKDIEKRSKKRSARFHGYRCFK